MEKRLLALLYLETTSHELENFAPRLDPDEGLSGELDTPSLILRMRAMLRPEEGELLPCPDPALIALATGDRVPL